MADVISIRPDERFRGRLKSGLWIYRDWLPGERFVLGRNAKRRQKVYLAFIDPKTVGQHTGRADRTGTAIYEGDIIQLFGDWRIQNGNNFISTAVVRWGKYGHFVLCYAGDDRCVISLRIPLSFFMQVIGNIHDNPEMLGGAL